MDDGVRYYFSPSLLCNESHGMNSHEHSGSVSEVKCRVRDRDYDMEASWHWFIPLRPLCCYCCCCCCCYIESQLTTKWALGWWRTCGNSAKT